MLSKLLGELGVNMSLINWKGLLPMIADKLLKLGPIQVTYKGTKIWISASLTKPK